MLRVIPGRYGSSSGFRRDLKLKIVGRTWKKRAEELRGEISAGIAEPARAISSGRISPSQ
jgi:hypothetical protein